MRRLLRGKRRLLFGLLRGRSLMLSRGREDSVDSIARVFRFRLGLCCSGCRNTGLVMAIGVVLLQPTRALRVVRKGRRGRFASYTAESRASLARRGAWRIAPGGGTGRIIGFVDGSAVVHGDWCGGGAVAATDVGMLCGWRAGSQIKLSTNGDIFDSVRRASGRVLDCS